MRFLTIAFLLFSAFASADDLTTETLKRCGVVWVLSETPTERIYKSSLDKVVALPASMSLTSATLYLCEQQGLDFSQATDPYSGLGYNQKLSAYCADYLTGLGYTRDLRDSIFSNAYSVDHDRITSATLAGCTVSEIVLTAEEQTKTTAAENLRKALDAAKVSAYAKYPKE